MAQTQNKRLIDKEATVIDCDVHQTWASEDEIAKYLPSHYQDRGVTPPGRPGWVNPIASDFVSRIDAVPEGGGPPGSDIDLLEEQLFDDFGVDYAVLTGPLTQVLCAVHPNVHYAKAFMEAYNDWLIEEWLNQDDRFLGSLIVAPQSPRHAVDEIKRVGSHDQMVQVMVPGADQSPYGHERYWPIFEAAEQEGLSIAMHGTSGMYGIAWSGSTSAGIPISYPERYLFPMTSIMGQLASIILEGVFVEYPDLQWMFMEGGACWIPSILWKMDQAWKGALKETVPWLEKPPSEYVREHVRFSTQPLEEPEEPEHLAQIFNMIHADEILTFSSDYPHWDNDNPKSKLRELDADVRRRIMSENARELFEG